MACSILPRPAAVLAAGLFLLTGLTEAQIVIPSVFASIDSIDAPTGSLTAPHYVIDADAGNANLGYDRDKFSVDVNVDFSLNYPTYTSGSQTFRAYGQLIDDQGAVVALEGGSTSTISATETVSLDQFTNPTDSRILTLTFDPGVDLGAGRDYLVRVRIQRQDPPLFIGQPPRWTNVDGPDDSAPFTVVHFTGPAAVDAARNVRGYPTGAGTWARIYAVNTDPDKDEFIASIPYRLMRYDVAEGFGSDTITVELNVDLFDDTGAPVALAADGKSTLPRTMQRFLPGFGGNPASPSGSTGTLDAPFRPANGVVLDSVNRRYHATITMRHVETPPSTYLDDGSADVAETQLLHFNGSLHWGGFVTTIGSLGNDPVPGTATASYVETSVAVDGNSGTVAGHPDLQFGDGVPFDVELYPDGHAEATSGAQQVTVASTGGPLTAQFGQVTVEYVKTRLYPTGATVAEVQVQLPQGLGFTEDVSTARNRFGRVLRIPGTQTLDGNFRHTANLSRSLPAGSAVFDEARPLVFEVVDAGFRTNGSIDFTSSGPGGVEYSHTSAFDLLEANEAAGRYESPDMAKRLTNDGYLRHVDPETGARLVFETVADGSVRLNEARMAVQSGEFTAHYPQGAEIRWSSGQIAHVQGGLDTSSYLEGVAPVTLPFDGSCPDDDCASGASGASTETSITVRAESDELRFTHDGGLGAPGTTNPVSLRWGLRGDGSGTVTSYAHRTGSFDSGWFHMAGHHGFADTNPALAPGSPWLDVAADLSPATVLFAGHDRDNPLNPVYPTSAEYIDGVGFYAGHNFVASNGFEGASRFGGSTSDYGYALRGDYSKYYVRRGGLSGRHVALDGSFSPDLEVYGYQFLVKRLQLTFLSNQNDDSWFDGAVNVPEPAGFSQNFLGMMLTCTGELSSPEIDPKDAGEKPLIYWNSAFVPHVLEFAEIEGTGPCYPERALVIGLTTEVAHIPGTLSGRLAFMKTGNIGTPANRVEDADGRLSIPPSLQLAGPGGERWSLSTSSKLYFNNPDHDDGEGPGFVTFAGTMDVPYFEDVRVHVITSANGSVAGPVYLTGGWEDTAGETYFSSIEFDQEHRGWPAGMAPAISLADYKNLPTGDSYTNGSDRYEDYRVSASQSLFGLVPLTYLLDWSVTGRYFKSAYPIQENELIVLQEVFHQVDYMSPEDLEVSFGAKYDGLPEFNLASAVYSAVDDQLGASEALTQAATSFVTDTLEEGVDELGRLVGDTLEEVLNEAINAAEEDVIAPLYAAVVASYNDAYAYHDSYNHWVANELPGVFDAYLDGTASGADANLRARLTQLADAADDAASVVRRIEDAVDRGILAIDSVAGTLQTVHDDVLGEVVALQPDPGEVLQSINGILNEVDTGDYYGREVVHNLVYTLIVVLAGPDIVAGVTSSEEALNTQLEALLSTVDPALDRVVEALMEARGYLMQVKTELNGTGKLVTSFQEIIANADAELDGIVDEVRATANAFIGQTVTMMQIDLSQPLNEVGSLLDEFSQEEFVALLRAELRDRLLNSGVIEQFQFVLRQWIYDLDLVMRSAVDTAFSEIRRLTQLVIQEALGPIDDKINGLLGDIGDYLGSGEIDGYAHIEGDSLKRLRIDGKFQFKIPDDMEINAYMEILCYDSGDDFAAGGCVQPGEEVLEVKLGATDVGVDWISPDMRADMEVKFSMLTAPVVRPRGVGGSFEMTGGSLEFEAFEITEFAAAVAVSVGTTPESIECYLAASARMEFSSYAVEGGIFFGRTCSLAPIEMINTDVAEVLGSPPFTGAYVYGEVWLPISEMLTGIPASCLFDISAGVGAGAFFFLEGPTWGGQMLLGVSGEALCIVSLKGELKMIGVMSGSSLRFSGRGTIKGKAGICPFCIKFKESAKIEYQNGDWSIDY